MNIKKRLGKRVKQLRLLAGDSQQDLASVCGLDRTYIVSVENGRRNVSIENVDKLAIAFGLSLSDFFDSEVFYGD